QVVKTIISAGIDVDAYNADHMTPLHLSSSVGSHRLLAYLLLYTKANIHAKTKKGYTSLHLAVVEGMEKCIRYLVICEGRDVNSPDRYGRTPLMHACRYGRKEAAHTLVMVGARIETEDIFGATAMNFA
ncbi:hypothetical protein GUITHDRAFT_41190, partial [Guillardia theta CCMP2712]